MDLTAAFYAFLSAVLMATVGIFSKITGLPAELIAIFRLIVGAGFMVLFLVIIKKPAMVWRWPTFPVIINGFFLAGFIIFYVESMNYTSMANAIMMIYLAPAAASIIAHFFLNERLTSTGLGLILLALFGFAMMMEFRIDFRGNSDEFIGLCYGFLALASYAGFILVNRIIKAEIHVYTRTFWQLLCGGIVMIPLAALSIGQVNAEHIPWLIGVGLFPGFLGIFFAVSALSRLPAATFGTISYIETVAVVIFGWTIFDETLNSLQIAGCLLIILSGIIKTLIAEKPLPCTDPIKGKSC